MKNYEAVFIFNPEIDEEKLEKEVKAVEKAIKTQGKGEVKFANLGKKALAYRVKKFGEGIYVEYQFTALPASIDKIKHALRHRESILRMMIIAKGRG
jgi:small subunit ribosomal protein S6